MDIHLINRKLREQFGEDFLKQPFFRIVWSDDEIEKRYSNFRDFIPGTNVLIRDVIEVREVKKYQMEPQYILERLFFNRHNKEILDNKTYNPQTCTYEPFWAFGHEKTKSGQKAKQPVWRAIELLIKLNIDFKSLTPSEMNEKEALQALDDEKIMMDLLDEHIKNDPLHSAIKDGDAVILDSTKRLGEVNNA